MKPALAEQFEFTNLYFVQDVPAQLGVSKFSNFESRFVILN